MRKWFVSDVGLKIAALVLATITWLFVKALTNELRTVEGVPVAVKVRHGLAATQTTPRTVNVTIRGTTEDLRLVNRSDLSAVVDLTGHDAPGLFELSIPARVVRHPRRVLVTAVEPANVVVRLEKSSE